MFACSVVATWFVYGKLFLLPEEFQRRKSIDVYLIHAPVLSKKKTNTSICFGVLLNIVRTLVFLFFNSLLGTTGCLAWPVLRSTKNTEYVKVHEVKTITYHLRKKLKAVPCAIPNIFICKLNIPLCVKILDCSDFCCWIWLYRSRW